VSWWGKVVGGTFGFMMGGPLGAVLGAALGHNFDKGMSGLDGQEGISFGNQERVQTAFFTATFSVMGAIAKADGRVSQEEINLARAVMSQMQLDGAKRDAAMHLFNEGKSESFPLDDVVTQFRRECRGRTTLIRFFIEIQVQAAYADGRKDAAEDALLLKITHLLGFSESEFRHIEQLIVAGAHAAGSQSKTNSLADAYAVLGVTADTPDKDVKKAYRRMMSQHHPDKLVAKGLPEEMMQVASQKTHEIKKAYDQVKEARGL